MSSSDLACAKVKMDGSRNQARVMLQLTVEDDVSKVARERREGGERFQNVPKLSRSTKDEGTITQKFLSQIMKQRYI